MRVSPSAVLCLCSTAALLPASAAAEEQAVSWPWPWHTKTTTTTPPPSEFESFEWGVAQSLGLKDITTCARDTNSSVTKLWSAAHQYFHGGVLSKAEALAKMSIALGEIVLALGPCSSVMTDAKTYKRLLEYLEDKRYYTVHNALTLSLNMAEDRKQLGSFIEAWHQGKFQVAGFVLTNVILDVLEHPSIPSSNGTAVEQITYGFGQAFYSDVDLKCFKDARVEIPTLVGGIIDIASVVDTLGGLESLFHGLAGLVPTLKDCMADRPKIMNLLHSFGDFKHPRDLAKRVAHNIASNAVDITLETASSILDYKTHSWQRFGEDLGKILGKIVIGDVMVAEASVVV